METLWILMTGSVILPATFSSMCIEDAGEKIRELEKYVNGEAGEML